MVCKEEVFTWFQNLQAHKRIEAMYMFLNMCYPLELRFCGTCLEDLARKDFYILREKENEANNINEVSKIRNVHDEQMRNHLILVLSLLNSSNTICAREIFRILSEEIKLDVLASLRIYSDPKLVEQYLLLLTLAQHHPAFNFAQQHYLMDLSTSIESCARELNPRTKYECEDACLQPVYPYVGAVPVTGVSERDPYNNSQFYRSLPPVHRRADFHQNLVRITNLKVKPPHRKQSIRIRVSWSTNKPTDSFKTPKDLMVFHQKLLELFPNEAKGTTSQEKFIPPFPQSIACASQLALTDAVITTLTDYIEQLNLRLPGYILENEYVLSFFMPLNHTRAALTKSSRSTDIGQGDIHSRNSRLRSLTIYNSQIGDNSSGHRPDCRQKIVHNSVLRKLPEHSSSCGRTSPITSPLQSPSSSPYVSPISSETNSRAGSPWNSVTGPPYFERNASNSVTDTAAIDKVLMKEQMQEQWDTTRKIEEIQGLPIEELQALGIIRDDSKKRKVFDMKSPPNGIINTCISKSLNSQKPNLLMQQTASNDSSPVCSEYSSPPQSPSPAEGCNQSTSLSSSNEENLDKRTVKNLPELLKIEESDHTQNAYDSSFKRTDDDALSLKVNSNRTTISVIPFPPSHYSAIISQLPPQNMKPAYLPIPCRTNNAPQHMSPNAVFENALRVPLPSALSYLQGPPRSHAVTPDRVLSTPNIPISSVSPFPVVTSGCATLPSATCCITSHKSSTVTVVTNSAVSSNRHSQKNPSMRDTDVVKPVPQPGESAYASAFILSSSAQLTPASCSCFTTNSARPSPAPSPSMSPGANPQPSAVPVSLPYIGMPYVFHHHSIPFLTAQASANGFVPQPGMSNPGQSFGFALNGLATLPPELVYPAQTFALQSPTQGNPGQVASPGSQCYGAFPQTAVPVKLMSSMSSSTSCYNCGKIGHRGADCKEPTMDDLNKTAKFQLNYTPIPKIPDPSHE